MELSVNGNVKRIVDEIIKNAKELRVKIEKIGDGATLIDTGVEAQGGYMAGKYLTEACMGGFGGAYLSMAALEDMFLPAITVTTDFPSIALFGAQFAGWRINVGKYFAMGSGPARALALKPKELYARINYRDESESATIILETSTKPPNEAVDYIAKECNVIPEKLIILIASTSSIAGSTQISGRILEMGLHKLVDVGLDPAIVLSGVGSAPIAPIHPKFEKAMGRTNDMLLYSGTAFFNVVHSNDEELKEIVDRAPSSKSKDYGKPFSEIFKEAKYNFYMIDSALFAPAVITVNNVKTGKTFTAGKVNTSLLRASMCL